MKEEALKYHEELHGKLAVTIKTECETKEQLSLAYSPGVAFPCLEIAEDEKLVNTYTNRGNAVAVVSDGTAVLGLGDIGPKAAMPVMEGKAILFKKFAGIDAYPICLDTTDTEEIIRTVKLLAPTFAGVNLEDISAPRCFEIETRLIEELDIPVFHDDQHGTAIVTLAGLINALEFIGKKKEDVKVVVSGAGSAAISISKFLVSYGFKKENFLMLDRKGVLTTSRDIKDENRKFWAVDTDAVTLNDAIKDADIFIGVSAAGVMTAEDVKLMAKDPLIFAMANPVPEIMPDVVHSVRDDVIMATGRSDFPNQVNNVLGFPGIFRGALDANATKINEEMKMAAAKALAGLITKEEVTKEYIIPNPFDDRVVDAVATAVAKAAKDSGVA